MFELDNPLTWVAILIAIGGSVTIESLISVEGPDLIWSGLVLLIYVLLYRRSKAKSKDKAKR